MVGEDCMTPYDVICFSSVPWGAIWGRTMHLMCNMARIKGCRVLYINPDIDLVALLQDPKHFIQRIGLKNIMMSLIGRCWAYNDNVLVYTPIRLIPFSGKSAVLRKLDTKIYADRINKVIQKKLFRKYVLWVNRVYPYDHKNEALKLDPVSRVFDWDDDWLSFSKYDDPEKGGARDLESENAIYKEMLDHSDVVFVVSDPLYKRACRMNKSPYKIRNATALCDHGNPEAAKDIVAEALADVGRPRIGYVGHICNRIDLDMIGYALERNERFHFVLLGPIMKSFRAPEHIRHNRRVHFTGPIVSHVLGRFLRSMDVLVIPHLIDDTTDAQDPVKLYDYLSTGKPIVTTRVAGVEAFRDLVRIVESAEEFFDSIISSLAEKDEGRAVLRKQAAEGNSWNCRAKEVIHILEHG